MKMIKRRNFAPAVFIALGLMLCNSADAQIRSGAAFLKMLPGGRLHSMAASHTAVIDDIHAVYANPGAAGFLREWHWAASYSKWIADIYNASFVLGSGFRTPWSRHTQFALGVLYHGVPEFNSSDLNTPLAHANDLVASLSIGQPLSFVSDNISIGSNIKYLRSTLNEVSASALLFDAGLTLRSKRFSLGNSIFPYGIVSAGAAIAHVGPDLVFDREGTPLPRTQRAGVAFYMGRHEGLQLALTADYRKIKDESGAFGLGLELFFNRALSLNGGYDYGGDLMNKFSFGASIRLDDVYPAFSEVITGRNNSLRLDLATLDDEYDLFSRTYRGTASHYPIRPEAFRFLSYVDDDTVYTDQVTLEWETFIDPDLFDDAHGRILIDRDRSRLDRLVRLYDDKRDEFYLALHDSSLLVNRRVSPSRFTLKELEGGDYYWCVVAIDRDRHIRFAQNGKRRIAHFYVPTPDVKIEEIEFDYSPWITTDDYHGVLRVIVSNAGSRTAGGFSVLVQDSLSVLEHRLPGDTHEKPNPKPILHKGTIESLSPGEKKEITFEWHTAQLGHHWIVALADADSKLIELDELNNRFARLFYTIPKGTLTCADSALVLINSETIIDLPVITEVTFDPNRSEVAREYLHKEVLEAPLSVIAGRLEENRSLSIELQGFIDPNSGENSLALAGERSAAVRDSLVALGVGTEQIKIIPGRSLPKRYVPKDPTDARRVFEERRYVSVSTGPDAEMILFAPIRHVDMESYIRPVPFQPDILCAVDTRTVTLDFAGQETNKVLSDFDDGLKIDQLIPWKPVIERPDIWRGAEHEYSLALKDSLGREFKMKPRALSLSRRDILNKIHTSIPLKFSVTESVHEFYWERILEQARKYLTEGSFRMRFGGHSCEIGPDDVNRRLSERRAERFRVEFLNYIRSRHPDEYDLLVSKLDPVMGYGEDHPLQIEHLSGESILLGDNDKSMGRKLNRRVEIVIYLEGVEQFE